MVVGLHADVSVEIEIVIRLEVVAEVGDLDVYYVGKLCSICSCSGRKGGHERYPRVGGSPDVPVVTVGFEWIPPKEQNQGNG